MVVRIACALALVVTAALPMGAGAQTWPQKPIRLVVPFPAGGPADFFGRGLSNALKKHLDQPVVIDNRSGAAGIAGAENVAKSPADGYSVLIASPGSMVIAPAIAPGQVPYDTLRDFAALTQVVSVPEAVVVTPKLGVKTLQEFVALAKSKPGTLNMASTGSGSMPHLAGELLKREAAIDALHVPYRGAAPALNDLLSGQITMMITPISAVLQHVQSGALLGIAVSTKQRVPFMPDVPTIAESGVPDYEAYTWNAIYAPAATPRAVIDKLNASVNKGLATAGVQQRIRDLGNEPDPGSPPEALGAFLGAEMKKWSAVIETAGIKPE